MRDTTENFPAACEVRITNQAGAFYGMTGLVCGRDVAAQTIQVALFVGIVKTCATECVARVR
jgi:hypothetical protein